MSPLNAIRETLSGFKSLIVGMRITAREAAKPIITVQYPHDTLPMPARFRGHIQLVLDPETGRPRCTACTLCAKACPSGCIELDGIKREGDKKKSVSKYMLDFSKCSLCGSCVEVCPSDAIDFSKQYNVVSFNRSTFDQMDLYAAVEAQAAAWAQAHPQSAAVVSAAAAVSAAEPAKPGTTNTNADIARSTATPVLVVPPSGGIRPEAAQPSTNGGSAIAATTQTPVA